MKYGVYNLTEGNIFRNLLRLAFPLMGTSFLQMAYTLLAMSWVGRLGTDADPEIATKAEAAIGAIGMFLWMTASVAYLAMIGAEVSVGQSIGAKKMKRATAFAPHYSPDYWVDMGLYPICVCSADTVFLQTRTRHYGRCCALYAYHSLCYAFSIHVILLRRNI